MTSDTPTGYFSIVETDEVSPSGDERSEPIASPGDIGEDRMGESDPTPPTANTAAEAGRPPERETWTLQGDFLEASVLGLCLASDDSARRCVATLKAYTFASKHHGIIFHAIKDQVAQSLPCDPVSIAESLRKSGKLEAAGGRSTVGALLANTGSETSLDAYIESLLARNRKESLLKSLDTAIEKLRGGEEIDLPKLRQEIDTSSRGSRLPDFVDLAALLAQPPVIPWLIGPYLARGDLAVMGAQYGTGKTWFAQDLSIAVATGTSWLGQPVSSPGSVIYIDSENPLHMIRTRISKLLGDGPIPKNLHYLHFPAIRIDDAQGEATLEAMIDKVKPSLMVFDTLSKFHAGNEDKAHEMARVMLPLLRLARKHDVAILLLHHYGKNDGTRSAHQLLRGSSAIGDNADQVYALQETRDGLKLSHVKARLDAPADPVLARLDDTQDGTRVKITVLERGSVTRLSEDSHALLDWVREKAKEVPEGPTRAEIIEEFKEHGLSPRTTTRVIHELICLRLLIKGEKKGKEVRYLAVI